MLEAPESTFGGRHSPLEQVARPSVVSDSIVEVSKLYPIGAVEGSALRIQPDTFDLFQPEKRLPSGDRPNNMTVFRDGLPQEMNDGPAIAFCRNSGIALAVSHASDDLWLWDLECGSCHPVASSLRLTGICPDVRLPVRRGDKPILIGANEISESTIIFSREIDGNRREKRIYEYSPSGSIEVLHFPLRFRGGTLLAVHHDRLNKVGYYAFSNTRPTRQWDEKPATRLGIFSRRLGQENGVGCPTSDFWRSSIRQREPAQVTGEWDWKRLGIFQCDQPTCASFSPDGKFLLATNPLEYPHEEGFVACGGLGTVLQRTSRGEFERTRALDGLGVTGSRFTPTFDQQGISFAPGDFEHTFGRLAVDRKKIQGFDLRTGLEGFPLSPTFIFEHDIPITAFAMRDRESFIFTDKHNTYLATFSVS